MAQRGGDLLWTVLMNSKRSWLWPVDFSTGRDLWIMPGLPGQGSLGMVGLFLTRGPCGEPGGGIRESCVPRIWSSLIGMAERLMA